MYHPDTYEILTKRVYLQRSCYPTDIYLDRLWVSLDYHRPNIEALIASLERDIQSRTEGIDKYPDDAAYINQSRQYIARHREWIALIPEISDGCAKSEAHNEAIFKELDRLHEESARQAREFEAQRPTRKAVEVEPVKQGVLF